MYIINMLSTTAFFNSIRIPTIIHKKRDLNISFIISPMIVWYIAIFTSREPLLYMRISLIIIFSEFVSEFQIL